MKLARAWLAPLVFTLICGSGTAALAQQHYAPSPHSRSPGSSMPSIAHPARVQSPHVTQPIKTAPAPALVKPTEPAASKPEALAGSSANGAIPASAVVGSGNMLGPSGMIGAPPPGSLVHQPAPHQPLSDVLAAGTVRITIRAISAAGQGQALQTLDIDGRLSPIGKDLRSFADQFSYRNYRLLDVQTFDLDFRSIAQMELPGQRAIAVEPRELGEDGRVKVHLELLGQHPEHAPRMRADYSISRGATIFIGGYKIAPEGGTLLLAITQDE